MISTSDNAGAPVHEDQDGGPLTRRLEPAPLAAPLVLSVIAGDVLTSHPLPATGRILIGRGSDVEIKIPDSCISRHHAALTIGPKLILEDLGSVNGTRVGGHRLEHGERRAWAMGEMAELANISLVVRRANGEAEASCRRHGSSPEASCERRLEAQHARRAGVEELDRITTDLSTLRARARCEIAPPPEVGPAPEAPFAGAGDEKGCDGDSIVVRDPAMLQLHELAVRVAASRISVLLLGETGSGKEIVAEVIHRRSPRRDKPFLRLNCAAFSENLLESELFGHEKGAFSGAIAAKPGLLECAEGGTVFLDEVGEMPLSLQTKLLRVLQERKVLRVGATKPRSIDVRFVAATHRDLKQEVRRGTFREDLFFRLNGIALVIPPLRERPSEIVPLALFFLCMAAKEAKIAMPRITVEALEQLRRYDWPGNVRELCNVMERAMVLCGNHDEITLEHLPLENRSCVSAGEPSTAAATRSSVAAGRASEDDKRLRTLQALHACAGNQTQAAKLLGISRTTMVNWLVRYDLPRPRAGKPGKPQGLLE
jgi:DNA-binding NtrC family response regulator